MPKWSKKLLAIIALLLATFAWEIFAMLVGVGTWNRGHWCGYISGFAIGAWWMDNRRARGEVGDV